MTDDEFIRRATEHLRKKGAKVLHAGRQTVRPGEDQVGARCSYKGRVLEVYVVATAKNDQAAKVMALRAIYSTDFDDAPAAAAR